MTTAAHTYPLSTHAPTASFNASSNAYSPLQSTPRATHIRMHLITQYIPQSSERIQHTCLSAATCFIDYRSGFPFASFRNLSSLPIALLVLIILEPFLPATSSISGQARRSFDFSLIRPSKHVLSTPFCTVASSASQSVQLQLHSTLIHKRGNRVHMYVYRNLKESRPLIPSARGFFALYAT